MNNTGQIETLLFDLGNVILYIDFSAFWRDLGFFHPAEIAPFKERYTSLTLQYETGNISTHFYLNGLKALFNNKFSVEEIENAFSSIIQEPVDGIKGILKQVSAKCRTALVSNTNEIHFNASLLKFQDFRNFQKQYLSYKLHVMKPAREFYGSIINDQGIPPSKMLFIDDIEENITAARNAGMQALQFKSAADLEAVLKKAGIIK